MYAFVNPSPSHCLYRSLSLSGNFFWFMRIGSCMVGPCFRRLHLLKGNQSVPKCPICFYTRIRCSEGCRVQNRAQEDRVTIPLPILLRPPRGVKRASHDVAPLLGVHFLFQVGNDTQPQNSDFVPLAKNGATLIWQRKRVWQGNRRTPSPDPTQHPHPPAKAGHAT